jgi:hypothetical protein
LHEAAVSYQADVEFLQLHIDIEKILFSYMLARPGHLFRYSEAILHISCADDDVGVLVQLHKVAA